MCTTRRVLFSGYVKEVLLLLLEVNSGASLASRTVTVTFSIPVYCPSEARTVTRYSLLRLESAGLS